MPRNVSFVTGTTCAALFAQCVRRSRSARALSVNAGVGKERLVCEPHGSAGGDATPLANNVGNAWRRPCRAVVKVVRNTVRGARCCVFFSAGISEGRPALIDHEAVPKILQATLQSLPVVVDEISHARSPLTVNRAYAVRVAAVGAVPYDKPAHEGAPQCTAGPTEPRAR